MSNRKLSELSQILVDARKLIENERNWVKRVLAMKLLGTKDEYAYCALGAVYKASGLSYGGPFWYAALNLLDSSIKKGLDGYKPGIVNFNNDPKTTHKDILKVFDDAIEASLK